QTSSKTMSVITMTLIVAICGYMGVVYFCGINMGHLAERMVFDLQMGNMYTPVSDEALLSDTRYDIVREFLDEQGIAVKDDVYFETYLPQKEQFHQRVKYDFPFSAIALSDYNALLNMQGLPPIDLAEDEFATQWYALASDREIADFVQAHQVLETDNGTLRLAENPVYTYKLSNNLYNAYTSGIYIIPDHMVEGLLAVEQQRAINLIEPLPYDKGAKLGQLFDTYYAKEAEAYHLQQTALKQRQAPLPIYHLRAKSVEVSDAKSYNFIMQSVVLCGATVLLVICFTMLALQQLSDATHFKYRFGVLRRLGVDEARINRLIQKQLGLWFGLPIGFGYCTGLAICLAVMFGWVNETRAYIGFGTLLIQVGAIALVLGILFTCYYIATYLLFKRIVNK
ncbi:MAG: ABC transporter permease, partial [Cellulosilyticaceae bacterium]